MRNFIFASAVMGGSLAASTAQAFDHVRFVVVDPVTGSPVPGVRVTVEDVHGVHPARNLSAGFLEAHPTADFNLKSWSLEADPGAVTIVLPLDTPVMLQQEPPVKDIYIKVTATRILVKTQNTSAGNTRDRNEISKFVNTAGGDSKKLTQGQSGVASDSAGQQHVRGEHTEITYVVDGVPLPDTLSGRQGSIVVPSTIERLEILTGGFAPEFGGQTAAVLNIQTLPSAKKFEAESTLQTGSYQTWNGDFTAVGPFAQRGSFVLNVGATRTNNAVEPQQPDQQTAHNHGEDLNLFGKVRLNPSSRDSLTLTLSRNPGRLENGNRTGLPASFAPFGQGYGFLGLRNADGTRPDLGPDSAGLLGADPVKLLSQEDAGQDIFSREVSEFATLNWSHRLRNGAVGRLSLTGLHSGQDVRNRNPNVDVLNLPVDSSIEYNPIATRNVHHLQLEGSLAKTQGMHSLKTGFLFDQQSGSESYQLTPASRLALDALASLDSKLVPDGTFLTDEQGNPVLDVNGNAVFVPASGVVPVLSVHRKGRYMALYAQDTWRISSRWNVNYGLRADWFYGHQDLGQADVNAFLLSPRINFSYAADRRTAIRWSFNRLFNTPPLAQGAIVGDPIQPEVLDQYDVSIERATGPGQTVKIAYYAKQMKNQVDVGLLVPGSQIGLYSGVNLQYGGVHGVELSYDVSSKSGLDGYLNYSFSAAKPNGVDSTGENVPDFNDHDQRHTVGAGLAYTWKSGATLAGTLSYGSGLASSVLGDGARTPRFQVDMRFSSGDRLFGGHGGLGIDIENVFDSRQVINFQSAFSGTRFQQGRRILVSATFKF